MTNPVARHVSLLFDAIRFYSRIPVPALPWEVDPHAVPDFRILPRMLPLAALLIAVPSALVLAAGSAAGLPPYVAAALGVTVGLLTTGAMHEDGLADTVDGFGGGHTVERRLEIMADSRTGAYGVAALVMMLVIRTLVLGEMIGTFGGGQRFCRCWRRRSCRVFWGLCRLFYCRRHDRAGVRQASASPHSGAW